MQNNPKQAYFDLWLALAAFCGVALLGACVLVAADARGWFLDNRVAIGLAAGLLILTIQLRSVRRGSRALWHATANRIAVGDPRPVARAWVVDGDTIDDKDAGERYRLANIDAPETHGSATCWREGERGEAAKHATIALVRRAKLIAVRETLRRDQFGRRIAFVYVDGADLGELLLSRGLACRWKGLRRSWCGPNGQLSHMAKVRGESFSCKSCRADA